MQFFNQTTRSRLDTYIVSAEGLPALHLKVLGNTGHRRTDILIYIDVGKALLVNEHSTALQIGGDTENQMVYVYLNDSSRSVIDVTGSCHVHWLGASVLPSDVDLTLDVLHSTVISTKLREMQDNNYVFEKAAFFSLDFPNLDSFNVTRTCLLKHFQGKIYLLIL